MLMISIIQNITEKLDLGTPIMAVLCAGRAECGVKSGRRCSRLQAACPGAIWHVLLALGAACAIAQANQDVVRTTHGTDLEATNITFFHCNTYSSCTQCVNSSFPCDWCVDGNRCTHDAEENCRNDILVNGVSKISPSYRSGPMFCPTINSLSDGTNEILVPSGVKKAIKVKVSIIGQFIVQTRFICQFNIEGSVNLVTARLLADTIYCDAVEFTYTSRVPSMTASFAVIWGGSKPLDNPDNIHIRIYRCNDMADNCGTCLGLPEKFGCGWCQGTDKCESQEQCGALSVWLKRTQACPNHKIHSFRPQLGAQDGGTNTTIEGINSGRNISSFL